MLISRATRGLKVQKLQYRLGITTDGIFGTGTEKKVKEWQSHVGLDVTGEMRDRDWNKMFGCNVDDWTPIGIVVHSMSEKLNYEGKILTADKFLEEIGLSVHCLIHPHGEIQTLNKTNVKCLHAGKSEHNGLKNLNSHFLGFEVLLKGINNYDEFVENIQHFDAFTQKQTNASIVLTKMWMDAYNIPAKDVVRHSDVSGDDVRGVGKGKVDPGSGFDWGRFKEEIQ